MGALSILLSLHETLPVLGGAPGLTPCSMQDLSHSHFSGHGSGQAKPKPGQSQHLRLGLRISEAKATQSQAKAIGFRAKPSQNITNLVYFDFSSPSLSAPIYLDDDDTHLLTSFEGDYWYVFTVFYSLKLASLTSIDSVHQISIFRAP